MQKQKQNRLVKLKGNVAAFCIVLAVFKSVFSLTPSSVIRSGG